MTRIHKFKCGHKRLQAIDAADPIALIDNICDQRLAFLQSLPTGAESKDLMPAPLARSYSCACATLRRVGLGVLTIGSSRHGDGPGLNRLC